MKLSLLIQLFPIALLAQVPAGSLPLSKYGLPVVGNEAVYRDVVRADPENALVDMRRLLPEARYDVTYATSRNFLKRKVYPTADLFMRRPAADALVRAAARLKEQGLGLLLFDGYRPYAVTVLFYEEVGDTTFVADPRKGSKHNRGMAIDLSLYDLKTGKPLPMPSDYDEASPRAYHEYQGGDPQALRNRAILREAMEQAGFHIFKWEWWHYDYAGWENCLTYDLWHKRIAVVNRDLGIR